MGGEGRNGGAGVGKRDSERNGKVTQVHTHLSKNNNK